MKTAVIFDMDGVLIDSVGMNWQSYNAVLKADYNVVVEPTDIHKYVGRTLKDQVDMLSADYKINIDGDSFTAKTNEIKKELLKSLQPMPGVKVLLDDLRKNNIPIAVGTSAPLEVTEDKLRTTGLLEYFDVIVTSDHVSKHKPEPDVYLECAKQLGIEPKYCVVVEDAPAGVESAHAANMKCLAIITPYVDLQQLRIADMTVESLETVNLEKLAALVRS
jgi:HAD superfamily hydrolase (TIGR01509 family)